MRARSLKPGIFKNELLAVEDPLYTIIFQGLWCMADRAGRLEFRPARIHFDINPGRDINGTERAIEWLIQSGFVRRYDANGKTYLQVENFLKHQNPHCKEPDSTIPAPGSNSSRRADSGLLTADSGPLTPDSLRSSSVGDLSPSSSDRAPRTLSKSAENKRRIKEMAAGAVKGGPR